MEDNNLDDYNAEEKNEELEKKKKVPTEVILNKPKDDPLFFYPDDYREKIRVENNIPSFLIQEYGKIGIPYQLRNNVFFLSNEEIVVGCGNSFDIFNISKNTRKSLPSQDIKGIGCISVTKCRKYIAVGECGYFPNILIYQYFMDDEQSPIKLYRIMRKGTENSFSALCFNDEGTLLASAGSEPDHNLIIWNWKTENIILKAKAFSQEVFTVNFSDNFEGKLITSGMGHIKFWEMANTFTGLKLQGELGKFGQVDLSDVYAYLEFPDGKILCGTEQGTILLWEGIFIKTQVFISEDIPCHGIEKKSDKSEENEITKSYINTQIECMYWEGLSTIITSGHDGYIKWWNYMEIENAEIDDNFRSFIQPIKSEIVINKVTGKPAKIISIVPNYLNKDLIKYINGEKIDKEKNAIFNINNLFWIIQDSHGFMYKAYISFENSISSIKEIEILYSGFSKNILTATPLENTPYLIVEASDNKICLVNAICPEFPDEKIICSYNTISDFIATSCCIITPISESEDPTVLLSGFQTGLVRIYQFNPKRNYSFEIINQIKIHDNAVIFLKVSPEDRSWLLSGTRYEVFIQLVQSWNNITPLFFIRKEDGINDIDWLSSSKYFIIALNDGSVEQISVKAMQNNTDTYELANYDYKKMYLRNSYQLLDSIEANKKKLFKKQEEPCKGKVYSLKCANMFIEDDFLVTCCEPYENYIFLCSFELDRIPNNECTIEENVYVNLRPTNHWVVDKQKTINTRVIADIMPFGDDIKYNKNELHIKLVSKDILVVLNMNGSGIVQIHHKKNYSQYIEIYANPSNDNILLNAFFSSSTNMLNFCYSDGTIVNYLIDFESILSYISFVKINLTDKKMLEKDNFNEEEYDKKHLEFIKSELIPNSKTNKENEFYTLSKLFLKSKVENEKILNKFSCHNYDQVDVSNIKTLEQLIQMRSLENIRKDVELEAKIKKADQKKNKLREKIEILRSDFANILAKNENTPKEIKLSAEEMIVDEVYIQSIAKVINENLDDIKHKYDWLKCIEEGTIGRLDDFFLKSVKTHIVKLYTLSKERDSNFCTTIRCPALPDNFEEAYYGLEGILEEYTSKINFEAMEKEYAKYLQNNDGLEIIKEEDIMNKVAKIKARIEDFHIKTDTKSGERVNFGKDQIKIEIDQNIADTKDLEYFKKNTEKQKIANQAEKKESYDEKKLKCPVSYTLKINYDIFYTEEQMKTVFAHKLEILNFLKILYDSREEFNNELLKLRDKKIKIIQEAKLNKQKLIAINNELGIRSISNEDPKLGYEPNSKYNFPPTTPCENLDWLNLEMKEDEFSDNILQIKPDELENFIQEKYKSEKITNFSINDEENSADKKSTDIELAFPYNGGTFNIPTIPVYNELKLNYKDRGTKKQHDSIMFKKMKEISRIKLNYKKKRLIEETVEMIDNFDREVKNLRKKKLDVHFKQKLGELELFIKHEEYNILRAFETDDKLIIERLDHLNTLYKNNIQDLDNFDKLLKEHEEKVKGKEKELEEKWQVNFLF